MRQDLSGLVLASLLGLSATGCEAREQPVPTTLCEAYDRHEALSGKRVSVHANLVAMGDLHDTTRFLFLVEASCPKCTFKVMPDTIEEVSNWELILAALKANGKSDVEGDYVGKAIWSPKAKGFVMFVESASNLKSVPPRDWVQLEQAE